MGKKGGAVLGRNLARTQQKTKKVTRADKQEGYLHTTDLQDGYDWGRLNLASVTEEDSYQDFLNTAELAGRDFDAEKWNVKLLDAQTRQVYIDTGPVDGGPRQLTEEERILPIPRRPEWTGLSPEQLREAENKSFLEWRRSLAAMQEETRGSGHALREESRVLAAAVASDREERPHRPDRGLQTPADVQVSGP